MSSEEDSYYPILSIYVAEEDDVLLRAQAPEGLVKPYVEALVHHVAQHGMLRPDDVARLARALVAGYAQQRDKETRIKQLETKLRHLRGR